MRVRPLLRLLAIGVLGGVTGGGLVAAAPAHAVTGPDPSVKVALDRSTYRLGDAITGTVTITNRGDAPAAGIVVHVFTSSMHVDAIDFGEVRQTNPITGVLDRGLAAGETIHVTVHASATGFLLAPVSTTLTGRVDYTGDVDKTNNWDQVTAYYDTSGSIATVDGTVFLDRNRDGVRQVGETAGAFASPSLWWAPGQGQGVGITADGRYSFVGIIGQQYELHFDVDDTRYVGTSQRVYVFTLGAGGRTIDYGVLPRTLPWPPASTGRCRGCVLPGGPWRR